MQRGRRGRCRRTWSWRPATVHRLLSRAGLMERLPEEPTSKDHRRFSFEKAGELWMSDVMHGPAVTAPKQRVENPSLGDPQPATDSDYRRPDDADLETRSRLTAVGRSDG